MKTFSGVARFAGCQPHAQGVLHLALLLGVAMFLVGCGKKSENPQVPQTSPTPTTQATSQAAAPAAGVNSQPAPAAPTTNAATAPADLQQLNQQLIRWVVQNHQRPKSFEDFVARANIQVPPPPAGKKYVINQRGFIALVDSLTR